jgi:RimJ/RimL family protein N-acetyltransferase
VGADAHALAALANDWDVARQLRTMPHPYTLEDAEGFLRLAQAGDDGSVRRVIVLNDGTLIGTIGAHPRYGGQYELGYWLGQPYWGRGYASEAVAAMVGLLSGAGIRLLHAGHAVDNAASAHVLIKAGFLYTGVREMQPCLATGVDRLVRMMVRLA